MANDIQNDLEDLKKQFWALSKDISQIEDTDSQISEFQDKLEEMESSISSINTSIENINSSLTNLTENVIPNLSSGSGGLDWQLIYDKDSEDENINWGYTDGIPGNTVVNYSSILNYKLLKIRLSFDGGYDDFIFDIYDCVSQQTSVNFKILTTTKVYTTPANLVATSITLSFPSTSPRISFLTIYKIVLSTIQYTYLETDTTSKFIRVCGVLRDDLDSSSDE